jgi:hypothetical protein
MPTTLHWTGAVSPIMTLGANYAENPPAGPQAGDSIVFDGLGANNPVDANPGLPNLASIQFDPAYITAL